MERLLAPYALAAAILAATVYVVHSLFSRGRESWRDYWPQLETCVILLIVYGSCRALFELYGRWDLFWQFGVVDTVAGVALWAIYEKRWQRAGIGLFAALLLVHIGYGLALWAGVEASQMAYNRMINGLFYLQILLPVIATWLQNRKGKQGYGWLGVVDTASAVFFAPCGPNAHAKARG